MIDDIQKHVVYGQ